MDFDDIFRGARIVYTPEDAKEYAGIFKRQADFNYWLNPREVKNKMGILKPLKPTDTVTITIDRTGVLFPINEREPGNTRYKKASILLNRNGVRYISPTFLLARSPKEINMQAELRRAADHIPEEYIIQLPDSTNIPYRRYVVRNIEILGFSPEGSGGFLDVAIDVDYTEGESYINEDERWVAEIGSVLRHGDPIISAKALFEINRHYRKWKERGVPYNWDQKTAVNHAITSTRNLIGMLINQTHDDGWYPLNPDIEIKTKLPIPIESVRTRNLMREIFLDWDSMGQILESERIGYKGGPGKPMGGIVRKEIPVIFE